MVISSRSVRFLTWILLPMFPVIMLSAESQFAMVMVNGVASLNGNAIANSDSVRAGDSLETGANSRLAVSSNGSSILIGADSRVRYLGDSLSLQLGLIQIDTSQRFRVVTDTIKIEPTAKSAKFRIHRTPRTVVIAALQGELRVDNNGEMRTVQPETTVTLSRKDQDEPASPVRRISNPWFFWPAAGAVTVSSILLWKLNHKKKSVSDQIP